MLNFSLQREVHCEFSYTVERPEVLTALRLSPSVRDVWVRKVAITYGAQNTPDELRALLMSPSFERLHCISKSGTSAAAREEIAKCMADAGFPKAACDKVVYEDYPDGRVIPRECARRRETD